MLGERFVRFVCPLLGRVSVFAATATLEDVVRHSARFLAVVADSAIDGDPPIDLTEA
jgi:hypothetical protein